MGALALTKVRGRQWAQGAPICQRKEVIFRISRDDGGMSMGIAYTA